MSFHKVFIAGVAALALSATGAFAQELVGKYNVPFAFEVSGRTMPAGEYMVRGTLQNVLQLGAYHGPQAFVLDNQGRTNRSPERGKLVFHQYGNQYFLSQIAPAGSSHVTEVTPGKHEKEIKMAAAGQLNQVVIAAE